MKKIKELLKEIWLLAKGNKTIFLSILWGCIEAGLIPITGGWLTLIRIILSTLGAGALYDHRKHFTTKSL